MIELLNDEIIFARLEKLIPTLSTQTLDDLFDLASKNGHVEVVGHTKVARLLLSDPRVTPQNKKHKIIRHNLIRDQAIVLNQLPYGPYGRLPALITSTILSFVYDLEVKELYDDMAKIKKSIDKIKI